MKDNKEKNNTLKTLFTIGGFFLGIYLILIVLESLTFSERFGPFVKIAGINVGGKTPSEAINTVTGAWESYKTSKITINGREYTAGDLISKIDIQSTIYNSLKDQSTGYLTFAPIFSKDYSVNISLDDKAISDILLSEYDKNAKPAQDAKIILSPAVQIIPDKVGQRLKLPESRMNIQAGLADFKTEVELKMETMEPMLTTAEASNEIAEAQTAAKEDITIESNLGNFTISRNELASWVKVSSASEKSVAFKEAIIPTEETENYSFFDEGKVLDWVNQTASKIDKSAKNATLGVVNGQVVITSSSQTGYDLDKLDIASKIQAAAVGNKIVQMKITETLPEINESKIAEMGLKELVSTGYSNFAGSPNNRKVNIAVGASKFNGVMIKPGQEFSFNTALGPVDASTGFLPELVILQNKTSPEYGGGLCQVSSTAFRAALNAGLPINERHFHAYPVSYYKPYGVDATIYLPWPDLKFTNDTGHYIFIQTHIEGTRLTFDFYGTKADRTIKFSGNSEASGVVNNVENMTPSITEAGARGNNSFTATFYRHIYDLAGKLIKNEPFVSKYDSPDKYPH